ncbi:T6SS immunity protein Tli4 family protein [Dyella flava]|nr:T6SS immunity protein Tli4 family protein [Dyella flava]
MTDNPLLSDPRPWCIGRFVIDRPTHSEVSYEKYEFWGDKINIINNVSLGTFQHKASEREDELRKKRRTILIPYKESVKRGLPNGVLETDASWLEKVLSPTQNSRLFIFKEDGESDASFSADGYVLAGTTMLTMKSSVADDGVQKFIDLTTAEYQSITYRENWTVPAERGFCINGALIGGPSRNSEVAEQTISMIPGKPSLFVIKMRDAVEADRKFSLLKTLPDLRNDLKERGYSHNVRVLREGNRQVAGMDAEEVLLSIKDGETQVFQFYLQAPGNPDTTAQPHTEIQLLLGDELSDADKDSGMKPEDMSSPVDEAGAIQAWDTLLNSMRLRPGAM